jgi:hypothetical protein
MDDELGYIGTMYEDQLPSRIYSCGINSIEGDGMIVS